MSTAWTPEQDDQTAFEEAMDVADISTRALMKHLSKLRVEVEELWRAPADKPKQRNDHAAACFQRLQQLMALVEAPTVTRWRQKHSEGRGKRHSQQHVLEVKLAFARELLTAHGVDLESELAQRRLGS